MKNALLIGGGALAVALGSKLHALGYHIIFVSFSGVLTAKRPMPSDASYECIQMDLLVDSECNFDRFTDIDTIYFCAAPKYWLWPEQLLPLTMRSLSISEKLDVPFIYADNLYVYGAPCDTNTKIIDENSPHSTKTRKGLARKKTLEAVLEAHSNAGVKTVVVQASDFYGPGVDIAMVGEAIFSAATQGKTAYCLGNIDKRHSFTYIDDFAEAMVLAGKDATCYGQVWIAPTDKHISMREFVGKIAEKSAQEVSIRVAPKLLFWFLGLRNKAVYELREVYYLYNNDFVVSSDKFEKHFNRVPTALDEGIDITLKNY